MAFRKFLPMRSWPAGCPGLSWDVRTPRNTKAIDIPHVPYMGLQRTQQREQVEGRMFTGVQPYLSPNYLEIKPGGAKVSQLGHPGENVGGKGNPARD